MNQAAALEDIWRMPQEPNTIVSYGHIAYCCGAGKVFCQLAERGFEK